MLTGIFPGADAVVHLAWQIQPSHDRGAVADQRARQPRRHRRRDRGRRAEPDVASSVGVYAPGPKNDLVGEDWPATGVAASSYSRDKVTLEGCSTPSSDRDPGRAAAARPDLPARRAAPRSPATSLGPLRPDPVAAIRQGTGGPANPPLRLQAVHADDVADAYVRAIESDVRGAFNVAAEPDPHPEGRRRPAARPPGAGAGRGPARRRVAHLAAPAATGRRRLGPAWR